MGHTETGTDHKQIMTDIGMGGTGRTVAGTNHTHTMPEVGLVIQ